MRNTRRNPVTRARRLALSVAAAALVACAAPAAAQTWTGNASADWNVPANWSSNPLLPFSAIDTALTFGATGPGGANLNQNIATPFILNSLTLTPLAPAYIFNGNQLDFRNNNSAVAPQIIQNSGSGMIFNTPLILTNNLSINGTGNGNVTFNGAISGAGGLTLNTNALYTLSNGFNTYAGTTTVSSNATLQLGSGTAIPSGRNVIVNAGAAFNTAGLSNSPASAIGTLTLNDGIFRTGSGSSNYYLNRLVLSSSSAVDPTIDFTGSTNAALRFVNPGAAIDVPTVTNWIGAGTSHIQNDTAATMDINLSSTIISSAILANGSSGFGFRFFGNGNVTLSNPGNTANLAADGNVYIHVSDPSHLGTGSLSLGASLGALFPGTLQFEGPTASTAKNITLTPGGGQIWNTTSTANLTLSGNIGESAAGQRLLIAGNLGAAGAVVTLSGNNSYTGPTIIGFNGTLSVNSIPNGGFSGPLGASTSSPANLTISAHPAGGQGTLRYTGPSLTTDRGATLGNFGDASIEVTNPATNLTLTGQLTGPGKLVKTGPGSLAISNAGNNFSAGVRVNAGRLILGSANALPNNTDLVINAGGEFNTGGFSNLAANAPANVTFNGGTLRAPAGGAVFNARNLSFGAAGGFINASTAGGLAINGPAAITVAGDSAWNGPANFYLGNATGTQLHININSGRTVTSGISLAGLSPADVNPFLIAGGGRLHLTNPAQYVAHVSVDSSSTLRMDNLLYVEPASLFRLTLEGGTLEYGGPSATNGDFYMASASTINILNAASNLSLLGLRAVGSPSNLNKTGPGTLTLDSGPFTMAHVTVSDGTLRLGIGIAIPPGRNVTVLSGAEFNTNGLTNTAATRIGIVTLDGGTLRIPSGSSSYLINQLMIASNGGTVDLTGPLNKALALGGPGAAITATASSNWTGPTSSFIMNSSNAELPINISPGAVVTSSLPLAGGSPVPNNPFLLTGGGTLYLTDAPSYQSVFTVRQARLRMNELFGVAASGSLMSLTLDDGTLQYSGLTSTASGFALASGGGTIDVSNAATTLTLNGPIPGSGMLTKTGPGTLNLDNTANAYLGGITVAAGRLDVSDDNRLGLANPTVNALGTLRYTASTSTARSFNLNGGVLEAPAGVTLALNGASVGGGFLRSAGGTFVLQGGTQLAGSTTTVNTTLNQSGAATVSNFTNNGIFQNAAGQTLTWNGGNNTSAGTLFIYGTVNGTAMLSNGQMGIYDAGALNNSGSPLFLGGGSTTQVGTSATPGGTINLGGQSLELRGGLLVNNGTISNGVVNVNYGGLAKGSGVYPTINVLDGGRFSPGNSPGTANTGSSNWGEGAGYLWEINDAAGVAGANWDLWNINGTLDITAGTTANSRFTVSIASLTAGNSPGNAANFNNTQNYSWMIASTTTGITGFDAAKFTLDASTFTNPLGGGSFALNPVGNNLFLNFTPGVTGPPQWSLNGSGTWNVALHWEPAVVPNDPSTSANFLGRILSPSTVTLDGNKVVGAINFDNVHRYTIAPGSGGTLTIGNGTTGGIDVASGSHEISAPLALSGTVSKSGAGALTISGVQSHGAASALVVSAGELRLSSNAGLANSAAGSPLALRVTGGAGKIILDADQDLKELTVAHGDAGRQTLDLASGAGAAAFNTIRVYAADLATAKSSLAAAIRNANQPGAADTLDGIVDSGLHASSGIGIARLGDHITIRPTRIGDLNLDGAVTISDFIDLASNFNSTGATWQEGDLNYDAAVTIADFIDLASNFNSSYGGQSWAISAADQQTLSVFAASVPEPNIVLALLALSTSAIRRKRVS